MAIAQLFFRKGNFISNIQLDIILTESATATARVTNNPVENGADANDHIIIDPMTFAVEGVVSDISSSTIGQFTRVPTVFNENNAKSKEAWEALLELQISRTPFTLVQGLKEYDDVIILTLSESQNKDTARGLFFTATMKQFIFVGAEIASPEQFNEEDIADGMVPPTQSGLKQLSEG